MKKQRQLITAAAAFVLVAVFGFAQRGAAPASTVSWNPRAAASYLDTRIDWWQHWPNAQRDHNTSCVSCHTAVPYALARPKLRMALGEDSFSPGEHRLLEDVTKRVRLWNEVEPFYPDQTRGLPKSSESRGTEAVMNALILATRDASTGMWHASSLNKERDPASDAA